MNSLKTFVLLIGVVSLFSIACRNTDNALISQPASETKPSSAAVPTNSYQKDGVSFPLPDKWKVTDDDVIAGGYRYISVENDGHGLINLLVLPDEDKVDLMKYANDFISNMSMQTGSAKVSKVETRNTQQNINGYDHPGIEKKFVVSLMGETVPHTAQIFLVKGGKTKAVVITNTPDDESTKSEAGYQAVFQNLKLD